MRPIDFAGSRFNRLVGIRFVEVRKRRTFWLWQCDCGATKIADAYQVKSGHTRSCGCYWADLCVKHRHGHDANGQQSRTYKAWVNMRSRVGGASESARINYVARGITVCERWGKFENFLADMGECPKGLSLDRIDNDGNYEPRNCRWATPAQQSANTRRTLRVVVAGETVCLAEACRRLSVNYQTATARLRRGLTPAQAVGL